MPIPTSGSVDVEIPSGTQTRWRIPAAEFKPLGMYGPEITLDLDVITPEYVGTSTIYSARIQRPRLDKVERLRKDGLDNETIASVLRKQGYQFKDIDEPDTLTVGRAGNLYAILVAINGGDRTRAEAVLKDCKDFDELAAQLVNGRFVGTTKLSEKGYVRLDGNEDIFPDVAEQEALEKQSEKMIDDLPNFNKDEPKAPF